MTTNQTIDGVPLLPCPFCGGEPYGTHDHYVHDDLSPMPCVECRSCSAHLKAEDWNRRVPLEPPALSDWECGLEDAEGHELVTVRADEYARLKAAQSQGEPVVWIVTDMNGDTYFAYDKQTPNDKPLYAEQPAPVATIALIVQAIHDIPEFPGITGSQIRQLAERLNAKSR